MDFYGASSHLGNLSGVASMWLVKICIFLPSDWTYYPYQCQKKNQRYMWQCQIISPCCSVVMTIAQTACVAGFYMALENCHTPVCQPCKDNEYMNTYNRKSSCTQQPYCDPNLNFENVTSPSRTEFRPCKCKTGYHCSTTGCLTCVKHTECEHGQGVTSPGNATSDTVCTNCPSGTFSDRKSAVDECKTWTNCPSGFVEKVEGTHVRDRVCKINPAIPISLTLGMLLGIGLIFYFYKKDRFKRLISCIRKKPAGPNDLPPEIPCVTTLPGQNPEEVDDLLLTNEPQRTENNNPVAQEEGKKEHVPMLESGPD